MNCIFITYKTSTYLLKLFININKKTIHVNNNLVEITEKKIKELVFLISDNIIKNNDNSVIDFDECLIEIINDNEKLRKRVNAQNFKNFALLKDWISEYYA